MGSENALLLHSLLSMSMIVEARDPYTGGHLWRVSQYARLLAQQLNESPRTVALAEIGGFLHDLGKVGVPDAILRNPGRLTEQEFAVIKTHPAVGQRLLTGHPLADLAMAAVIGHHERPDGTGYPNALAGESIPLLARIVGIADAFDAMTSTRSYRVGMLPEQAFGIIGQELDKQFDGQLGRHFLSLKDSPALEHIIGHSEPGIPVLACPSCLGPVVIRRRQEEGAAVFCRCCGGGARLYKNAPRPYLEATGETGDAATLAPEADQDLIRSMSEELTPLVL